MARKQESVYKITVLGIDDIKKLNTEISKLNGKYDDLKKGGDDATNTTKGFGLGMGGLVKGAAAATAALVAFNKVSKLVTQEIRKSVTVFKSFEFEMAKVKAISGANEGEFRKLNKTAQELGRSTFFTAQQVAALQLNFSKLGFTSAEVLQVQEAALLAATATGEDLARTATVIGATVRGFGLDATEGARVSDVMAASFTSSALTLEKFQTSMTKVSSVAKILGFDLEETTAIMGVLTDAGIEASIAGTSLRQIFLKMGDPSSDLAKKLGFTVNSSEQMIEEFRKLRDAGVNVEDMLELVDARQVQAIANMIEHIDKIEAQTEAFRNSEGAAAEMADIIGNTLQGATLRFQSALDGLRIVLLDKIAPVLTTVRNGFADLFNILASISEKTVTEALQDEQMALRNLSLELNNANISQDHRIKLINKLKLEYPNLLENLDAEKASNQELETAIKNVNQELQNKILLSIEDEKQMEQDKKTAKEFIQFRNKRREVENQINVLIDKQKSLIQSRDDLDFNEEELITLQEGLSTREQSLHVQEEFEKFYRKNFAGRSNDLVKLETLTNQLKIKEGEYTTEQTNSLLLMEEKRKLMEELGIFEDEQKKKRKEDTGNGVGGGDVVVGLPEADIVSNRMQEIEDEIARKTQELRQFYIEGRIATEAQLEQDILEMKLRTYNEEMNLLNMSSVAHNEATEKFISLKAKEKAAAEKANNDQIESNKKLQEQENQKIQNVILNAKTAEEALANLLTMKVNEILLEAMASLWKDATIPFLAKVGLAVGMKALITPLINNLLDRGNNADSSSGETEVKSRNRFERGGLTRGGVFKGASHANGGVKFRVGGTIHEAEGGEAIINKRSTARFRPILSAINSYNGNGVKFADGGIISQGEKFAMGGELRSVQSMISGSTTQKVVLVESDVTDTQNRISALESQSSF